MDPLVPDGTCRSREPRHIVGFGPEDVPEQTSVSEQSGFSGMLTSPFSCDCGSSPLRLARPGTHPGERNEGALFLPVTGLSQDSSPVRKSQSLLRFPFALQLRRVLYRYADSGCIDIPTPGAPASALSLPKGLSYLGIWESTECGSITLKSLQRHPFSARIRPRENIFSPS
jgi:hypothetical protein